LSVTERDEIALARVRGSRSARSGRGWGSRRRPSAGRWSGTGAGGCTGRWRRRRRLTPGQRGRRRRSWPLMWGWTIWCRPSWRSGGGQSRSARGWKRSSQAARRCRCHRDDLPVHLRAGAEGAVPGAGGTAAHRPGATQAAAYRRRGAAREDPGYGDDQRAARRGKRPGGARALGGRSDPGPGGKSAISTLVERATRFVLLLHLPYGHGADQVAAAMTEVIGHAARAAPPVADLGSGQRDDRPCAGRSGYGPGYLLLRSALALAAPQQRAVAVALLNGSGSGSYFGLLREFWALARIL
jgi:hypothetical protein